MRQAKEIGFQNLGRYIELLQHGAMRCGEFAVLFQQFQKPRTDRVQAEVSSRLKVQQDCVIVNFANSNLIGNAQAVIQRQSPSSK